MTTLLLEFKNIFAFIICSFGSVMILLAMFLIMFDGFFKVRKILLKIQFVVITIMFLLFDIEVLYLFPLIQSLYSLYTIDIAIIVGFYFILLVGLLYEISRKVLDFQTNANITMTINRTASLPLKRIPKQYSN